MSWGWTATVAAGQPGSARKLGIRAMTLLHLSDASMSDSNESHYLEDCFMLSGFIDGLRNVGILYRHSNLFVIYPSIVKSICIILKRFCITK